MEEVPEPKVLVESVIDKTDLSERDEQYMGTKQWLNIYGLGARRLELWDVLGSVAFKHRDGIVDLKVKPDNNTQTEALTHSKLINARYCDKFPVVKWKDGQVMHVQVTPEIHRRYERKINISLRSFHQRIDWLKQGSRALFGTVIEDQIYVLIDTSASMLPSITFVKDKLFILMQEQLRHKKKFNMVAFNSKAITWQNRMVDVTEQALIGAWKWIQNLSCWGSTNTYAALQHALSDPGTQAIYLLTDGRPDQPPKSIIAQVQMQHCVPVHAISFNCNDTEANQFLSDLAQATDGRYHYFSEKGIDADQPKSWESEDIRLLKEEIRRGLEHLQKIEDLRDECSNLSWKSEVENLNERRCSRNHPMPKTDRPSAVPAMDPSEIFRPDPLSIPRPKSAPPPREDRQTPSPPPRSASPPVQKSSLRIRRYSRPVSARKSSQNPLSASHTRTSLLRTMTSTGRFDPDEWLLPETRQLFEKQAKQQQQLAEALQRFHLSPYVVERRNVDQKRENARTFRKKRLARAKETSSKMWLSKHGLVAKKLTILDALAPTFIPRRAKYVPILDRHVLSKVFDDILPMAHVSSRKPHVTLINPSAVDLHGYEQKVHKAIVSFHKRLNKIVWEALPEEERKKLDSDKPVPFEENRNELLDALDNAGWPIKENDIILLEEEITRANNFLQQSKDLRRASDPRRKDSYDNLLERVMDMDDQDKSSSSSSSDSESDDSRSDRSDKGNKSVRSEKSDKGDRSVRSDKSDKGDRSVRSDRSKDRKEDDDLNVYDDKASVASSLTDKSTHDFFESQYCQALIRKVHNKIYIYKISRKMEMEDKLEGLHLQNHYKDYILRYYDEMNRDGKGKRRILKNKSDSSGSLSQVMKSHPEKVYDNKMEKIQFNSAIIRKVLDTLKGQSVIARNDKDGFYYPGTVVRCPDPRHADIQFEDKEERTVPTRLVIAMSGAIPVPLLRAGDCVLVRVQYTSDKSDCYVPGIVQVIPVREEASNKFYTVLMFNGQQATTTRNLLMKISKCRFEFAIRYIADIQNVDSKKYEDKVYVTPRTPRTPRPSDKQKKVRKEEKTVLKKKEERQRSKSSDSSRSRSRSPTPEKTLKSEDSSKKERERRSSSSSSGSRSESIPLRPKSSKIRKFPIERPVTPVLGQHEEEERERKRIKEKKRKRKLKVLRKQLLKQQEEQEQQQWALKQQRKKMKKMKKRLKKKKRQERTSERYVLAHGPVVAVESSSATDSDDDYSSRQGEKDKVYEKMPGLLILRRSLPHLREGEEVLARWSDEGWYFRGIVREDCGDRSYIVEDATHQVEKIWREDIITDYDDANQILQPKDPIVALHPLYSFSYAPGVILEVYHNMWMKVRFYDGEEAKIPREEAFKLTSEKFEHDVNFIIECETRWVEQAVVARDDRYGTYHLASVKKRIGNGREYLLEWCDGSKAQQNSIHIFGVYTKHHRLAVGDHVLAMMDEQQHMYLPGWIAGIVGDKINIKFCEGSIKDVDDVLQCFWLSNDYYDNAVQFFTKCQEVQLESDEVTTNKEEY
ncbi:unnamed protein product [Mytilus coruscus]|uniref:VWFA domain-containing protein n=1 Tax=Mytilus coruscus TaxID=42192 RepID=A0A6J8E661_MYTCO|nr:unnamed protein product [Mytilus coruscus]